jgi:hypothetical protein
MGSAEEADHTAKSLRKRVSLRSLISAHEAIAGGKSTLEQIDKMATATAIDDKKMLGMDLKLRESRLQDFPDDLKGSWGHQDLWGVPVKHLVIVELVLGSLVGVLIGLSTYDTRLYWWVLQLLHG